MARQKTPEAAPVDPAVNHEALAQAGRAATELVLLDEQHQTRVRAVAARLGYQLPADATDPDLIQRDIAANMRRSVEAVLEVGRGLCVLKETCQHGTFLARLDVLGIEARVAQKFMASAFKFANAASTPLLKAVGNQSKLFELLVLDDEQVEELVLTGQTGELDLDDVATMSVKELRAAVREAREGLAAKDGVISSQADKINQLDEKLNRPFKPKKGDPAKTAAEAAALQALAEAVNGAEVQFAQLAVVAAELSDHSNAAIRERALQGVQYLVSRMREIVTDNSLEVTVDDESLGGRPEWLGKAQD